MGEPSSLDHPYNRAYRKGLGVGRRIAAAEIDGIAADAIHPDDPPDRIAALLEIRRAARRVGGLDPIPDSERTGHA